MKTVTTRYGRKLNFDDQRWNLQKGNYACKIVGEREDDYQLQDVNNLLTWIPKATIRDNAYEIVGDEVTLSEGVYAKWITNPIEVQSNDRFQSLFSAHKDLLFANRQLVLSCAEYYFLTPFELKSYTPTCKFTYTLGGLFEAMEDKNPLMYFKELNGFREVYLVSLQLSKLDGLRPPLFWSEELQHLIKINPNVFSEIFRETYHGLNDAVTHEKVEFTRQGEALAQLLGELGVVVE